MPPPSGDRRSLSLSKAPQWLPDPVARGAHPAPHPLGILQSLCGIVLLSDLVAQWGQPSSSSPGNAGVVLDGNTAASTENPPGCFPGLAKVQSWVLGKRKANRFHPFPPTLHLSWTLTSASFCLLASLLLAQGCLEELLHLPAGGCDAPSAPPPPHWGHWGLPQLLGALSPSPACAFPWGEEFSYPEPASLLKEQ